MAGEGPLAAEVINAIKEEISLANKSCPDLGGKLRVGTAPSADLVVKDSRVLTHTLDLTVVPADNDLDGEPGAANSGSALVAAINAARAAVVIPEGFVHTAASSDSGLLLGDEEVSARRLPTPLP